MVGILGQGDLRPLLRFATAPITSPSAAPQATHWPMLSVAEPIPAPIPMPTTVHMAMFIFVPLTRGQIGRRFIVSDLPWPVKKLRVGALPASTDRVL